MKAFRDITNCSRPYSRRSSCSRKILPTSKSMLRGSRKPGELPTMISAKSWAVVSDSTGNVLFGRNFAEPREIASLTKIMNCYTALSLAQKWGLDLTKETTEVSKQAAKINGTRAELVQGDHIILWDLMHGMMLPSGNDAAICVAEYFGQLLYKNTYGKHREFKGTSSPANYFIAEMNSSAKELNLFHTNYANPHGLNNVNNKSTAEDLGRLCAAAAKVPKFKELVTCKEYSCTAITSEGEERKYHWTNTHKLLWEGYSGIKTGITPHAGPCLASYYEEGETGVIVILLGSRSMDARWVETRHLVKLALNRIKYRKSIQLN
eukprot:TRINITY_DN15151_c0_g1_i1.p1 TRINITY_DN15151_c0_g1~~TRINITY_DN15151_c0_g1_i1.p1  ORF type:complete len:321 (+),score=59.21 TRINITY_DN15151_c0_g1_i1:198-1160(+)